MTEVEKVQASEEEQAKERARVQREVEKAFATLAKNLGVELVDAEEVSAKVDELQEEISGKVTTITTLQTEVAVMQASLREWNGKLGRVTELAKTAGKFGLPVPERFASLVNNPARSAANGTATGNGKLYRFDGFGSNDKRLASCTMSRGIVLTTKGCGGSGLEGRLHRDEFDAHLAKAGLQVPQNVNDQISVTLPNGKNGTITRIA